MTNRGNGYLASPSMQTSTANQEIIYQKPEHWTHGYRLYKFSFSNKSDVTVIINNETTAFLEAGQGFEMAIGDKPIQSFIIVEADIIFNWLAAY